MALQAKHLRLMIAEKAEYAFNADNVACIVSERLRRNASHPDLPANPRENLFPTNLLQQSFLLLRE
jgi:hypothetical protein